MLHRQNYEFMDGQTGRETGTMQGFKKETKLCHDEYFNNSLLFFFVNILLSKTELFLKSYFSPRQIKITFYVSAINLLLNFYLIFSDM